MKTTAKRILGTARHLLKHRGTLAIFAALYAGLLAALYGFVATREATVGQVLLTLVFLLLIPLGFFILQAAIILHGRDERIGWQRTLSHAGKLAVVTLPIIILGVVLFVILDRWQPRLPSPGAFSSSWPGAATWSSSTAQVPPASLHWPTLLFATLRWVLFGVILPLVTIHLWIEIVAHGWRALIRGGARSVFQRVRYVLERALGPESVLTYTVGLVLFALIPYAVLFVAVPVKGTRTDFAIFIGRLVLVFLLTLFGWLLTITTLARNVAEGNPLEGNGSNVDEKSLVSLELQAQS